MASVPYYARALAAAVLAAGGGVGARVGAGRSCVGVWAAESWCKFGNTVEVRRSRFACTHIPRACAPFVAISSADGQDPRSTLTEEGPAASGAMRCFVYPFFSTAVEAPDGSLRFPE